MATAIAEPPHLAANLKGLRLDGRVAVAAPGRASRPPASDAGRLPGATDASGGDRTPGAPHPAPHPGRPLPDAEDPGRLFVRGAAGSRPRGHPADHGRQLPVWQPRSRTKCRHPGEAVDDADPRCRAHQHDRVLAAVKARRFAPPPLRGADGLDAGCAHGPGRPCPTARERSEEGPECDELTVRGSGSHRGPHTLRVETRAVTQHRAGNVEQAVGHRTQGAGVIVPAGAQRPILVVADRVALDGGRETNGRRPRAVGRAPLAVV